MAAEVSSVGLADSWKASRLGPAMPSDTSTAYRESTASPVYWAEGLSVCLQEAADQAKTNLIYRAHPTGHWLPLPREKHIVGIN